MGHYIVVGKTDGIILRLIGRETLPDVAPGSSETENVWSATGVCREPALCYFELRKA